MESISLRPLVTILSPVHNGARYLSKCIDSVLAQTYTNWEYLIVENCSTDDTYAIAKSYAELDPRIKVIKYDNLLPVVPNHNRAFALIPEYSKYCKPLMADDWLFPDCLERMVDAAEAHPSIGVVGCYAFDGVYPIHFGYPYPATCVPGIEALKFAMQRIGEKVIMGTPTAMLYRSDLVRKRKPFYNDLNFHADHETAIGMLAESDFAYIHQNLCLNRLHPESQTERHMYRLETLPAHEAYLLHKLGPVCLGEEELRVLQKRVMRHYYARLAHQWFRSRGSEFWDYHRNMLRLMGLRLEYGGPFGRAIFREFLNLLSNPVTFMRVMSRRILGSPRGK
jgi:glycosyltransferase involved in cell wall biosynthesis